MEDANKIRRYNIVIKAYARLYKKTGDVRYWRMVLIYRTKLIALNLRDHSEAA